jgi:uncharacterized protein (TIGR02646 family)
MVELKHGPVPPVLTAYITSHTQLTPANFEDASFAPVKRVVKVDLHRDQGGICVYCERELAANAGQVEHIKPKGGKYGYPNLAFTYSNYAHSCIDNKTCGQKKKAGLLPIEPGYGCNKDFIVLTNGDLAPHFELTRKQKHNVKQTKDMLGLNSPQLTIDRSKWLKAILQLHKTHPQLVKSFLADKPFRHILQRV